MLIILDLTRQITTPGPTATSRTPPGLSEIDAIRRGLKVPSLTEFVRTLALSLIHI